MTIRTIGLPAAALLALAGLPTPARSDNPTKTQPPAPASPASKSTPPAAPPMNPSWDSIAEPFGGFKSDTKPSRDVTMQFPSPTEVRDVLAVGGQRVKKGDLLIKARDTDVLAAIAAQKDMADNDLEILGAEKQAQLAQFKLDRIRNSGQYSATEFEEARIGAEVARVQADQAKRHKIQEQLKLKQAEASYERYRLEAPFDGIIEEIMVDSGEGVTEQTKVLRMVNIEKLWLDPYADTYETIRLQLKEGSPAWVLIDMPDAPKLIKGKVLYVSPVADSVSQTRRVRVEIDNPQTWPAGTQARVRFSDPGKDWEKYRATVSGISNEQQSDFSMYQWLRDYVIDWHAPCLWAMESEMFDDSIAYLKLRRPIFQAASEQFLQAALGASGESYDDGDAVLDFAVTARIADSSFLGGFGFHIVGDASANSLPWEIPTDLKAPPAELKQRRLHWPVVVGAFPPRQIDLGCWVRGMPGTPIGDYSK